MERAMNLTEHRKYWLQVVGATQWKRTDCATRNVESNRKMPEPVYWWLIENKLIEVDSDSRLLSQTTLGKEHSK